LDQPEVRDQIAPAEQQEPALATASSFDQLNAFIAEGDVEKIRELSQRTQNFGQVLNSKDGL
jgi:hypothetical protein